MGDLKPGAFADRLQIVASVLAFVSSAEEKLLINEVSVLGWSIDFCFVIRFAGVFSMVYTLGDSR